MQQKDIMSILGIIIKSVCQLWKDCRDVSEIQDSDAPNAKVMEELEKQREKYEREENPNARLYDKAIAQMEEERRKKEEEKRQFIMEETKGTRDLFMETLTKIGCQYELAEEEGDNRIFFAYQGEHFFADTTNELRYVHLWDTHWGHVELYDIDEFTRLKKAINGSNLNNSVTTVYTIDEDGKNVNVHSKSIILFVSQIPDLEDYLRLELNEFFRAHQYVGTEMAKLREKEEAVRS